MPLRHFHPATRAWFEAHVGPPTDAQQKAWTAIKDGRHALVAAPTGSGKTLAAFYAAIDTLVVDGLHGNLQPQTSMVYVSPLKALSNDIHRNLEVPLQGIEEELQRQGYPSVKIKAAVRTGDTTPADRRKMLKHPPHILVTTPESFYLLLTSPSGRQMLSDKRGAHLALSMERLEALTGKPLQRIGLSATQKPVELVACFLVGNRHIKEEKPDCVIIDTGHRRRMELSLEVPKSPLTAVMSNEVWGELYERLLELIAQHHTTLIFVNTRRLAERMAMNLAQRLGEEHVSSHHGSMSKEHRLRAEQNLKAGKLKVLVATASMELGIDIGSVDLVVQFSSPMSIAAFLQRVGRSGHQINGTPKGILVPLSRDDLMECTALLDSVRRGELDHIIMPESPMDILSQQAVAEVASQERTVDELYGLMQAAYPYRNLAKEQFLAMIHMLADGYTTRRGRRGAYLYYDAIQGRLRGRPGSRLAALTNGGAIPDSFDYDVVLEPEGIKVGTLNEDFALESLSGDIFVLGTHSWQLVRIEGLRVIVHDATGKTPTVPFWLGERPGRTQELSQSMSRLQETINAMLDEDPLPLLSGESDGQVSQFSIQNNKAVQWLIKEVGLTLPAAEQVVGYLWMGKTGLGVMPSLETIVMERFFDEAGDMHVVIHSLYGSEINRGWGLALRKKFCRNFNFELQAAAGENSIILSLSSSHSFPLEEVFRYLNTKNLRETLVQAMLDAPLFEVRWRWDATRSLAILRNRGGKRVPPYLQRMQAEDLIAQVFPDQIACAENIQGDREIPDHPLVNQVIQDCLTEAMDIEGLTHLIGRIERKNINLVAKDLREPSVFAQEIISARPYAFLDDTEFAERRVNAVRHRGWLDPGEARDLSKLDPQAIERVKQEAWPQAQSIDELHDVLLIHGFITESEVDRSWHTFLGELATQGRATQFKVAGTSNEKGGGYLWIAAERLPFFEMIYPEAFYTPAIHLPEWVRRPCANPQDALKEIIRGRLETLGPVTIHELSSSMAISEDKIQYTLLALEHEGFVFRGHFLAGANEQWCERRLLQRIHRYTIDALRESIKPVSVQDYMRFLFEYHQMRNEDEQSGPESLQKILHRLEGYQAPAAAWEVDLIPGRMANYDPAWLDVLCMSGKIVWGRFQPPATNGIGHKAGPIKSTPISLVDRIHVPLWQSLAPADFDVRILSSAGQAVLEHLKNHGASFFDDLLVKTKLLKGQVEEGLGELVANGLVISDSYSGLRALLTPESNKPSKHGGHGRGRKSFFGIEHAGRWSVLNAVGMEGLKELPYETLEYVVFAYLRRWGVLFRTITEKEAFAPPWRVLVRVLRRLELKGELRGGRFISEVSGEQFALPETIERLRQASRQSKSGKLISISAVDPLNVLGVLLPGKRVANVASNRIVFQDGLPIAVWEGRQVKYLKDIPQIEQWSVQKILLRRKFPTKLRYYLGKNYV